MTIDRPNPRSTPLRPRLAALAVGASLLGACANPDPASPVATDPPAPAMDAMTDAPTPFRTAYDALAALPPDDRLAELQASASLARLQGQVTQDDFALAAPLADLAANDRAAIRAAAIALIGQLASSGAQAPGGALPPAAAEAVLRGMDDDDDGVRLEATRAAAVLGGAAARAALLARLQDPSAPVRFQALHALHADGALDNDPAVRAAAGKLRADPDRQVRELAEAVTGG